MVCWRPASSALLEWLPLASSHSWFWQCEAIIPFRVHELLRLSCKQLHAGLIVTCKLLQA